ncbi:LysE family transporter [Nitrosomonas marina]|uniref:LysE family transporter n=1 Tax=Nitrosomonas marina TaxID=917 RepID=UPI0015A59D99|nr:LysE family transporter [Nitrosomonas marina]
MRFDFCCTGNTGIDSPVRTDGGFFLAVKIATGMHLIWFGINLIRSRTKNLICKYFSTGGGLPASFLAGLFVTLGYVKAIVFYASLFPALVDIWGICMTVTH